MNESVISIGYIGGAVPKGQDLNLGNTPFLLFGKAHPIFNKKRKRFIMP